MTKEKKLYLTAGFLSIVSILLGFIAFSIIIVCFRCISKLIRLIIKCISVLFVGNR
jgi:hypothetical protein